NGTVRNFGRFQVQSTTAVYNGTFNNSDRYESDHAKNVFQDFILDQQGYIKASDSSFFIAGDFLNGGGDGRWNTDSSSLTLTGAGLHHMQLNGTDKGAWRDGYANNRAWSELVLGAGGSLDLTDGLPVRRNGRAALYVGEVTFEDGIGQLSNIASDYNIYYDPTLAGNAYLGGRSYAFGSGSGSLVAAAVPEPESFALVLAGLAMTTFVRRRLRPSN
ncbi:MAG: PEP-CTERM sorting domain-containing protein, partial [Rubrivivax sp.]